MTTYTGLGLTSGSSLDGLDVCLAEFTGDLATDIWSFRILRGHTFPYDDAWRERLSSAHQLPGLELIRLHFDYAHFMGQSIQKFMEKLADLDKPGGNPDPRIDFVAAHGHTVFHQPDQKLTFQLGEGEVLSTYLKCPLITNFSVKDVCLGGQGAPLTGSVDRFLFLGVGLCLNLGGIASVRVREDCSAWDVCACNIVLNRLAQLQNPACMFDKNGKLSSQGEVVEEVLKSLEELDYYQQTGPKSISMEWINQHVWPILNSELHSVADLARTYVEHVALRVCAACLAGNSRRDSVGQGAATSGASPSGATRPKKYGDSVVLITGGGVHNEFLMKKVKDKLQAVGIEQDEEMVEPETIDFKEASSFAFLGMRCMLGKANVFAESTGSTETTISGSVHHPLRKHFRGTYPSTYRFLFRHGSQS